MKRIFISSVQKEFERERAAIKRMVETDPIIRPHLKTFNDARIIALVTENGNLTLPELADKLQIKYATLRTRIEMLKKRGLRHEGSRKAGKWVWRP